MKYLFALMDDETRFWIAQEVGDTKYKRDAGNLFRKGKEAIGRVLSDDNGPVPVRRYCSVLVGSFAIISLFSFDR